MKIVELKELAKLANQMERYDDMVEYLKYYFKRLETDLTAEERKLLMIGYKNAVGARRATCRVVFQIEREESKRRKKDNIDRCK